MPNSVTDFLGGIAVEVVGGALLLLLLVALRMPSRLIAKIRNLIQKNIALKRDAAGFFDSETIAASLNNYVKPKFQNIDPSQELEPEDALVHARDDLFAMMTRFLYESNAEHKHMFLFADSGMGKTSFLINYFAWMYRLFRFRRSKILLISLAHQSADKQIELVPLPDRKTTNLFLDALDEDARATGKVSERIDQLFKTTEGFRRVVITCRTQFFRNDAEIPVSTGIPRLGPTPARKSKQYPVIKVYLSPFDNGQVETYLQHRFPSIFQISIRRRARKLVQRVPSLSVRSMLLAHMPDLLTTQIKVEKSIDVYEAMVEAWAFRERDWISPETLKNFSLHLAQDLYENRSKRGGEFASADEVVQIGRANGITVPAKRLTGRSLLNRTSTGDFKFAHRSILEYFVANIILSAAEGTDIELSDQIAKFILEAIDCESDSILQILGATEMRAVTIRTARRLGHMTNFDLYDQIDIYVNPQALLLSTRVTELGSSKSKTLHQLILDMVSSTFKVALSDVRSVRIGVENKEFAIDVPIHVSVWVNSYGVLCEAKARSLPIAAFEDREDFRNGEVVFCADKPNRVSELIDLNWQVQSRVEFSKFPFSQVPAHMRGIESLFNNPGVGFLYESQLNRTTIKLVERAPLKASKYSKFGLLEDVRPSSSPSSNYLMVGPLTIR